MKCAKAAFPLVKFSAANRRRRERDADDRPRKRRVGEEGRPQWTTTVIIETTPRAITRGRRATRVFLELTPRAQRGRPPGRRPRAGRPRNARRTPPLLPSTCRRPRRSRCLPLPALDYLPYLQFSGSAPHLF